LKPKHRIRVMTILIMGLTILGFLLCYLLISLVL
jgi:hypothetical protein